jgi:hypothetical protein
VSGDPFSAVTALDDVDARICSSRARWLNAGRYAAASTATSASGSTRL